MKRLILCLGLATLTTSATFGQVSAPNPYHKVSALALYRATSLNAVGLAQMSTSLMPLSYLSTEQRAFVQGSVHLLTSKITPEEKLLQLQRYYPGGIDADRAKLLLALYDLEEGRRSEALEALLKLAPRALMQEEREQYTLALTHLLLEQGDAVSVTQARSILANQHPSESYWSDWLELHRAMLSWYDGDTSSATRMLEGRMWHDSLLPEVEYLGALIGLSYEVHEHSLQQALSAIKRYPLLSERPRLVGAIGQGYHILGNHDEAINYLVRIKPDVLTPAEGYALGASSYSLGRYEDALPALQRATEGDGDLSGLAQYALAQIYRQRGQVYEAQLALERVYTLASIDQSLRGEALYQLIELGFTQGHDAFGQQIRHVQTFMHDYSDSPHRTRVLDLVRSYISRSTDYEASLELLRQIASRGDQMSTLRQDVLVRRASSLGAGDDRYIAILNEAIGLTSSGVKRGIALVMRGAHHLSHARYVDAERDAQDALRHEGIDAYEHGIAHYLLGYARYNQQRYAEARPALKTFTQGDASLQLRADALIRLGDIELMRSPKSDEAIRYYTEANKLSLTGSDEAVYRLAHIYGLRGEYARQITMLKQLEADHPYSSYLAQGLYDQAKAHLHSNPKSSQADVLFASIEERYPNSEIAPKASLERALLASNRGDDARAIEVYKRVVARYPERIEARTALADLRSLYAEADRLDEYATYLATVPNSLRPNASDAEQLAYQALVGRARRGESVEAEVAKFVQAYPQSQRCYDALRLLVDEYKRGGRMTEALSLLSVLADNAQRQGATSQELNLRQELGALHAERKRYAEGKAAYERAFALAKGNAEAQRQVGLPYLRVLDGAEDWAEAVALAKMLRKQRGWQQDELAEVILLQGRAESHSKALRTAITTFATLSDQPNSRFGAEAIVSRATIHLRLGEADEAIKQIGSFVSGGSSQQYWMARAFVVLADAHDVRGERYLAKQYIESLRDNYQGTEADIQEMIQERLTKFAK